MTWKPWYEELIDKNSASEREAYLKGTFNAPQPSGSRAVENAATAGLAIWGISKIFSSARRRQPEPVHYEPVAQQPDMVSALYGGIIADIHAQIAGIKAELQAALDEERKNR